MGQSNRLSDQPSGPAIVHLRGQVFVAADAELHQDVVTFVGRLRVSDLAGHHLYEPRTRSHRLRSGEWVEWLTSEAIAA